MTTPALRSARRALPTLALAAALLVGVPATASASTLLHSWQAELTAADSVGSVNGTFTGSYTSPAGTGHDSERAFRFSGTNQDVRFAPHADFYPAGSFTVSAWVSTVVTSGPIQMIMSMDECGGTADPIPGPQSCNDPVQGTSISLSTWQLAVKDGRLYSFVRDFNGGGFAADSYGQRLTVSPNGPLLADGAWHHVVLIKDVEAGRISMYQDGRVLGEQVLANGASQSLQDLDGEADPVVIGARLSGPIATPNPDNEFAGDIDDVRFYSGAEYPDKTPPVITGQILGEATGEWYTSDLVIVRWTVRDESVIRSNTNCTDTEIIADTAGQAVTCSASSAGGDSSQTLTVKRDATPPVLTCDQASPRFEIGAKGTMSAAVTDTMTGPKITTISKPIESVTKGAHSVTLSAEDNVLNFGSVNCPYFVYQPVIRNTTMAKLATAPAAKACIKTRKLALRLRRQSGAAVVKAEIAVGEKKPKTVTGAALKKSITVTKLPLKGGYRVTVTLIDANGDKRVGSRVYRACAKKKAKKKSR